MTEPLLTKRLHISGLTPSITPTDLERRLSVFGKVKAMDGFGACDGLGDPRKFGFVTMEIGTKELAKCLNVLSGSTWKGAKLRIGEAKPDFRERIAQLNVQPPKSKPARPKRTPRNHGLLSSALPLTPLSTETAATTPGWIVTPSGRVVRPMRMRPNHPLDPTYTELSSSKVKAGKVKKRVKPPPVRARRRLIDPTKWDSVYLKGVYMDAVDVPMHKPKELSKVVVREEEEGGAVSESEEEKEGGSDDNDSVSGSNVDELLQPPLQPAESRPQAATSAQQSQATSAPSSAEPTGSIDIREEANTALAILGNLFGDQEDWGGSESVDEMEGLDIAEVHGNAMQVDGEDEIEIVPRKAIDRGGAKTTKEDKKKGKKKEKAMDVSLPPENEESQPHHRDVDMREAGPPVSDHASTSQAAQPAPQTSLKALFAPREEASFSFVDHLDLDLELEDDILGLGVAPGPSLVDADASQSTVPISRVIPLASTVSHPDQITLDPSYPLLFPLPELLSDSNTSYSQNILNCILFPPRTTPPQHLSHLHFLPPADTFCRSPHETSETIRARWEREKVALTREWKKASREAKRSRRARADRALPEALL